MRKMWTGLALGAGLTTAMAFGALAQEATAANDYGDKSNWVCWPGRDDACAGDNAATIVAADGALTREDWTRAEAPPIDCFYVYPTVSNDPGIVSDMEVGPEETRVVEQQLSRFASQCRVFAPLYRQFTLTALRSMMAGRPMQGAVDPNIGYNDVLNAWNWYLENENKGRGVVLIGHSQGSGVLTRLIAAEIDGKPVQEKLVSALLIGTNLPVEAGKDVGTFKSIPLCRSADQTGCVIAYASFRDTVPPAPGNRFASPAKPGMQAACVNPANLSGGKGELKPYLGAKPLVITEVASPPIVWSTKGEVETPFAATPGLLTAECVQKDGLSYLTVHVNADPADPRLDDIRGDVPGADGKPDSNWGLHLIDMQVAMGNLVEIVESQGEAWRAGN